jgi:2-C-methyl-D-erythritol 4-phosphate cytidylyltransferase
MVEGGPTPGGARRRTIAVVLAGGVGTRMGGPVPKQLLEVAGRPVIAHTLDAFERSPHVDEVLVVMAPVYVEEAQAIVAAGGYGKVSRVVPGGTTRMDSTWCALEALGEAECDVLLHDAARPFVPQHVLAECVAALTRHEAVVVALPATDTMITVEGDVVTGVPDRARLARAQTPQGFRSTTIRRAYRLARLDSSFLASDDCGVVQRYLPDVVIHVVEGSERNIKVTSPVDLAVAEVLVRGGGSEPA